MSLIIKNARIVDRIIDEFSDVYIEEGKIKDIGKNINIEKDTVIIDGTGLVLLPAFVDLHAHFREPGYTEKEDIESGSRSALRGGYTFVNLMANTRPVASNMEVINRVLDRSEELDLIDIHQVSSITENFDGETISHLDNLDLDKVKVISEDGYEVMSNDVMLEAMKVAKEKNLVVMSHAEDMDISKKDYRIAENIMTLRNLYLSNVTEAHLHLSHVSTKEALNYIRIFKAKKTNITCEVSPHHIALIDSEYRVNPPIRKMFDRMAIIDGIKTDLIDAIATDHAPHREEDKAKGAPGLAGLETAFSVCYSELVESGYIELKKLVELMSTNPSKIMGLNKGKIKEDYDGDLVLVDLEKINKIDSSKFASKGRNTIFEGMEFKGQVVSTIKAGKLKYKNNEYDI